MKLTVTAKTFKAAPGDVFRSKLTGDLYIVLEEEIGKKLLWACWGTDLMWGYSPILQLRTAEVYQGKLDVDFTKLEAINDGAIFERKN